MNSVILIAGARVLAVLLLVFSLFMLLRGHNYAALSPAELASHMVSGGQRSLFSGDQPPDPF